MIPHRRVRRIMRWLTKNGDVPAMVESMHSPRCQNLSIDAHFNRCELANHLFTTELLWLCADWWTATTSPKLLAKDELRELAEWCDWQAELTRVGPGSVSAAFKDAARKARDRADELEEGNG